MSSKALLKTTPHTEFVVNSFDLFSGQNKGVAASLLLYEPLPHVRINQKIQFELCSESAAIYQCQLTVTKIEKHHSCRSDHKYVRIHAQSKISKPTPSFPMALLGAELCADRQSQQVDSVGSYQVAFPKWLYPKKASRFLKNIQSTVTTGGGHTHSPLKSSELWLSQGLNGKCLIIGALGNANHPELLANDDANISIWKQSETTQMRWQQACEKSLAQFGVQQGKALLQMGQTVKQSGFYQVSPQHIEQKIEGSYRQKVGYVLHESLFNNSKWAWESLCNVERYSQEITQAFRSTFESGKIQEKIQVNYSERFRGHCHFRHQGNLTACYGAVHLVQHKASHMKNVDCIFEDRLSAKTKKERYQGKTLLREYACKTACFNLLNVKAHKQMLKFNDWSYQAGEKMLKAKSSTWECRQYFSSITQYQTQGGLEVYADQVHF